MGELRIERIDSPEGLEAAKPLWDRLLAACPHRTPFLTHEWTTTWWKHFGKGRKLCILVVHEASRPVLIAPLTRYLGRIHGGRFPVPALIIESIANYHSNRADFIYERFRPEYFQSLWTHLRTRERWHLLRLYPILEDAATVSALRQWIESDAIRAIFTHSQTSPYVPVSGKEAEKRIPKDISRSLRRAEREGRKFTLEIATDPAQLPAALSEVFDISSKGWAAGRGTAISSTPLLKGFYGDLARVAADRGWLFLSVLRLDGRAIAFEYNFLYGNTLYALKCGYDSGHGRWSPGKVLTHLILSHLLEKRPEVREYDALGDADPYKLLWGSDARRHLKAYVYRPGSVYARVLFSLHAATGWHPRLRRKIIWKSV